MIRILLFPKPNVRAKCEDTSPLQRINAPVAPQLPSFLQNLAPACMRPQAFRTDDYVCCTVLADIVETIENKDKSLLISVFFKNAKEE